MGGKNNKVIVIFFLLSFCSCVKDKPDTKPILSTSGNGQVFVICEGQYSIGNASLYGYNQNTKTVAGDLFEKANGYSLGDVFQSMTRIGSHYFLCINNSDKIVVIDTGSLKVVSQIVCSKPRYTLAVNPEKAYVSSLFNNKFYVINTTTFSIIDTINMPTKSAEGMCLYNDFAFISSWDTASNQIYKVDIATNQIVQTIRVAGYAPQEILLDKNNLLWILSGDEPEGKTAFLTKIDPSTGNILDSMQFGGTVNPVHPIFNLTKDTLFFIEADYFGNTKNNGIFRMSIKDHELPSQPFIQAQQFQYFWALGISPKTGYIYVGDPKGFIQNGRVNIYTLDGNSVDSFTVGVGPGHFLF